ncbi:glycosyltransferase family 4 protein [Mycobacterium sp. NPDC003323]
MSSQAPSAVLEGGADVCILSLHYPPETTGNAPYTGALAAGLAARSHHVSAYVAHPHYPEWKVRAGYGQWRSTEVIDGVTVHRMRHYVPQPPRGLRRLASEISFGIRLLASRFRSNGVVVAVTPALFATALAALRVRIMRTRPALVIWVQDIYTLGMTETKEGGGLSSQVTRFVERLVLRSADRVVVIHPRFADYISTELGVDPRRITVIRNWTHLKPAQPMTKLEARTTINWPVDRLLVVHTGNMGAKQGLDNVVETARLADACSAPIEFILVGDGSERARLEQLAEGVERITFVDPLDDASYRCALAAADCLLVNELPGVANMAVPSKLTSYFDAGRPVVAATEIDGITASEVRQANAGVVVEAGDPQALLTAALAISQDSERSADCGINARRFCKERLSSDSAIGAFEQVLQEVAGMTNSNAVRSSADGMHRQAG